MELYEKYVGLVFDNRYRIEKVIGIGGMAVVFKATDLLMRRTVAVKILKDEISGDEQSVKRFANEVRAVSMLSHQNIVNIYDISVRDNIKYIVMEYVDGITLKNYMQHREVLNLREIISYTTQILRALDHAHKKGVVHRDIKPQNIMLLKNGVIRVMDFGIAKLPNAETITMTDKAIGTVYYISPEQVKGGEIDARSDLYSLGVLLYEMATGRLPFLGETPVSVALMQVNDQPAAPTEINSHIPQGLEQIILRAMEKDPDARYQSAEEMLGHLLKLRENPRIIFREKKSARAKRREKNQSGAPRPKKRVSKSMFPIIMGVTLAFLITAGISGYYMLDKLFFNSTMNQYEEITIEEFVNHRYTDKLADWFTGSQYYEVPTIEYVHSDEHTVGMIMEQDPKPYESRKIYPGRQKCAITFKISLGPKTIVLEDYAVQDYRVVEAKLRKLGLKVVVENVQNDVYSIGHVIRTEPAAGTTVHENDTVTIYVSNGADTITIPVPNFAGLSEGQAMKQLLEAGLRVGDVEYVKSYSAAGSVLTQSVEAWLEVPLYTEIDFTVSGGANYTGDGTQFPVKETESEETEPWDDPFDPFDPSDPDEEDPRETEFDDFMETEDPDDRYDPNGTEIFKDEDFFPKGNDYFN